MVEGRELKLLLLLFAGKKPVGTWSDSAISRRLGWAVAKHAAVQQHCLPFTAQYSIAITILRVELSRYEGFG
jgi:hypothetical protein